MKWWVKVAFLRERAYKFNTEATNDPNLVWLSIRFVIYFSPPLSFEKLTILKHKCLAQLQFFPWWKLFHEECLRNAHGDFHKQIMHKCI